MSVTKKEISLLLDEEKKTLTVKNTGKGFEDKNVVGIYFSALTTKSEGPLTITIIKDYKDNRGNFCIKKFIERETSRFSINTITKEINDKEQLADDYKGRVILELLQNAIDAIHDDGQSNISQIGEKGKGFKSLYDISHSVKIYSPPYYFAFSDEENRKELIERKKKIKKDDDREEYERFETLIEDKDKNLAALFPSIIEQPFKKNPSKPFVTQIDIHLDDLSDIKCQLEKIKEQPYFSLFIGEFDQINIDGEIINYEAIHKKYHVVKTKKLAKELAVAFPIGKDGKVACLNNKAKLHVYFPTNTELPFNAILHGNFKIESNRKSLLEAGNEEFETLAENIFEGVLRDENISLPVILNCFAGLKDHNETNKTLSVIYNKWQEMLETEKLFHIEGGRKKKYSLKEIKNWDIEALQKWFGFKNPTLKDEKLLARQHKNIVDILTPSYSKDKVSPEDFTSSPVWETDEKTYVSLSEGTVLYEDIDNIPNFLKKNEDYHILSPRLLEKAKEIENAGKNAREDKTAIKPKCIDVKISKIILGEKHLIKHKKDMWQMIASKVQKEEWAPKDWQKHGWDIITFYFQHDIKEKSEWLRLPTISGDWQSADKIYFGKSWGGFPFADDEIPKGYFLLCEQENWDKKLSLSNEEAVPKHQEKLQELGVRFFLHFSTYKKNDTLKECYPEEYAEKVNEPFIETDYDLIGRADLLIKIGRYLNECGEDKRKFLTDRVYEELSHVPYKPVYRSQRGFSKPIHSSLAFWLLTNTAWLAPAKETILYGNGLLLADKFFLKLDDKEAKFFPTIFGYKDKYSEKFEKMGMEENLPSCEDPWKEILNDDQLKIKITKTQDIRNLYKIAHKCLGGDGEKPPNLKLTQLACVCSEDNKRCKFSEKPFFYDKPLFDRNEIKLELLRKYYRFVFALDDKKYADFLSIPPLSNKLEIEALPLPEQYIEDKTDEIRNKLTERKEFIKCLSEKYEKLETVTNKVEIYKTIQCHIKNEDRDLQKSIFVKYHGDDKEDKCYAVCEELEDNIGNLIDKDKAEKIGKILRYEKGEEEKIKQYLVEKGVSQEKIDEAKWVEPEPTTLAPSPEGENLENAKDVFEDTNNNISSSRGASDTNSIIEDSYTNPPENNKRSFTSTNHSVSGQNRDLSNESLEFKLINFNDERPKDIARHDNHNTSSNDGSSRISSNADAQRDKKSESPEHMALIEKIINTPSLIAEKAQYIHREKAIDGCIPDTPDILLSDDNNFYIVEVKVWQTNNDDNSELKRGLFQSMRYRLLYEKFITYHEDLKFNRERLFFKPDNTPKDIKAVLAYNEEYPDHISKIAADEAIDLKTIFHDESGSLRP